jgi:hypothetical protein
MKEFLTVAVAGMLLTPPAHAEPQYKLNKQQTTAIALSNLSPGGDPCVPSRAIGRVVAVKYNEMKTLPIAFTIEEKNGERTLINVDVDEFMSASRLAQGWVGQALQRMIRKGIS